MLFRVFSEVLVCVAAAFERLHTFISQFTSQDPQFLLLSPEQWRLQCAKEEKPKAPKQPDILFFFSQAKNDPAHSERFIEESGIFLSIYGNAESAQNSATPKDPLFSFTKTALSTVQNDPEGYEAAMSDFFAAIIKRIAAKFPSRILECLNSRPYLYFLKYGRFYINTLLNCTFPSSCYHSYSSSALLQLFSQIITIPELSLEIAPALQYVSFVLDISQESYHELIRGNQTIPAVVQSFYNYCLHICSVIDSTHDNHTLDIIGHLLGQLGAIAPNRFETKKSKSAIPSNFTEFDLARYLIKHFFVKDLMGLPKRDVQNRIALTVQKLLRFLESKLNDSFNEEVTADRELVARVQKVREAQKAQEVEEMPALQQQHLPLVLQQLFSEEEICVISQYWRTEYSIRNDGGVTYRGFEGISMKSYVKWITKLASRLLALCPQEDDGLKTTLSVGSSAGKSARPARPARSAQLSAQSSVRSSTPDVELNSPSRPVAPEESVYYLLKPLFSSSCSDKTAFLFPYIVQFALLFHGKEKESVFAKQLAEYFNELLKKADGQSDNECQHCLATLLSLFETLQAWQNVFFVRGKRESNKSMLEKSEVLKAFLSQIGKKEVVKVSLILGQYVRSLK